MRAHRILLLSFLAGCAAAALPGIVLAAEPSPALSSLVETERAFARTSLEKGIRDSFLAFFADDGVVFRAQPVAFKAYAAENPLPASPPQPTLDWAPIWADVSSAGDLGYTTGPWVLTDRGPDKNPPQHGYFFTIWKKQSDGSWKVAVDAGVPDERAPEVRGAQLQAAPHPASQGLYPEAAQAALAEAERRLAGAMASQDPAAAYAARLDPDARMARAGAGTGHLAGPAAIRAFLDKQGGKLTLQPPQKIEIAGSGDLGYAYGPYEKAAAGTQGKAEKGSYVRVWRRAPDGAWKIVFDTEQPAS